MSAESARLEEKFGCLRNNSAVDTAWTTVSVGAESSTAVARGAK